MMPSAQLLFSFIKSNRYCSTAGRLARLMMSMHNGRTRVSFWDDMQQFDDTLNPHVIAIVTEFLTGKYKDGDFNPVAHWLIDDCGYLDDVHKEERTEWTRDHKSELKMAYPLERENADETFEEFCTRRWQETERLHVG